MKVSRAKRSCVELYKSGEISKKLKEAPEPETYRGGCEAVKPEGMKVISGVLPQSESAQGAERHKLFRAVQSSEETKNSF